jgi:hypothetical protein
MTNIARCILVLLAATGLMCFAPVGAAHASTDIQMLPPTPPGNLSPCAPAGGIDQVLMYSGNGTGQSGINCIPRFTADPTTGNVGIGTSSPQATLDILGRVILGNDATVYALPDSHGGAMNGGGYGLTMVTDYPWPPTHSVDYGTLGVKAWGLGAAPSDSVVLASQNQFQITYWDGTHAQPDFFINPNGNVGIGIKTPQTTLDVNGEVRPGDSGLACSSTIEGAMRYNNSIHAMEYCNGTSWTSLGGSPHWVTVPAGVSPSSSWSGDGNYWNTTSDVSPSAWCVVQGYAAATGECRTVNTPALFGTFPAGSTEGTLVSNNIGNGLGTWAWACEWGDHRYYMDATSEILCAH